jgi:hypothetical protein
VTNIALNSERAWKELEAMPDLLKPMTEEQRLLLQILADVFLHHQQWPIFEYVEGQLDRHGLDARQLIDSLPEVGWHGMQHFRYGLVWHPSTIPTADKPVMLTIAGLWHLGNESAVTICNQFTTVLRYLIDRRQSAPLSPFRLTSIEVTSEDVAKQFPNMTPSALRSLGQFLPNEAATYFDATEPDANGYWSVRLHRQLLQYRDVTTTVDYLERVVDHLTPPAVEPVPAVPSPLDLCATLDYFNAVWQLHFDRRKPIIRLFGAERTARLVYGVNSADEFSTQVSCLADILKNLQVSGQERTPVLRLRAFLQEQLPVDSHARMEQAIAILRDVADVRNALFQHSGTEHRGLQAANNLGISFPIADWQAAWETVQRQMIQAFSSLREEIQLFHELGD